MTRAEPRPAGGRFVNVGDVTLHTSEHGSGHPLLLLHGGLESSRTWRDIVPRLADAFRVIAVDIRGHGRSTNPSGEFTYPLIAADIAGLVAALQLDQPFIVGWSDGGQHALQIASRYPELARALVAGAADFDSSPATKQWVRDFFGIDAAGNPSMAALERSLGDSLSHFRAMHTGGDEQWRALVVQTARMWLEYEGLILADYRRIERPLLVMAGDRDEDVPVEDAVAMYRVLPRGELAICPGADHFIPWRRPDWFAGTVREFLLRQP